MTHRTHLLSKNHALNFWFKFQAVHRFILLVFVLSLGSIGTGVAQELAEVVNLKVEVDSKRVSQQAYINQDLDLRWKIVNQGAKSPPVEAWILLSQKQGLDGVAERSLRAEANPLSSQNAEACQTCPDYVGGLIIQRMAIPALDPGQVYTLDHSLHIPRNVQEGSGFLLLVADGLNTIRESDERDNSVALPLNLIREQSAQEGTEFIHLSFEGLPIGTIPSNFYASRGVEIFNIEAAIAPPFNFCNNGNPASPTTGRSPIIPAAKPIINVPAGFQSVSMIYAQASVTQGGFRIWSGLNGTGTAEEFHFMSHPDNGFPAGGCDYSFWIATGGVAVPGKSIEFFENDGLSNSTWNSYDDIYIEKNPPLEIVVHTDPIRVDEDNAQGTTFGVTLSHPVEPGKSLDITLSRISQSDSGEDLRVLGNTKVTFNENNWNQQQIFTIRSSENDQDTFNQSKEFLLERTGGDSILEVNPKTIDVYEVDDDFELNTAAADMTPFGTVSPDHDGTLFDLDDDPWWTIEFEAIPDEGYRFVSFDAFIIGITDPLLPNGTGDVVLTGPTGANPDTIQTIEFLSGGLNIVNIHAVFEEIGTISLSMQHVGNGTTTIDGQTVDHNGSISVETGADIVITATPDPNWLFTGWNSNVTGIIADPSSPTTTVNSDEGAILTANFTNIPTGINFMLAAGTPSPLEINEGEFKSIAYQLTNSPGQGTVIAQIRRQPGSSGGDGDIVTSGQVIHTFDSNNWQFPTSVDLFAFEDNDTTDGTAFFVIEHTGGTANVTIPALQFSAREMDDDIVLTLLTQGLGSVLPAAPTILDSRGSNADMPFPITATPATDQEFVEWSGDIGGLADPMSAMTTITTTTDATITANFQDEDATEVEITVTHEGMGNTQPNGTKSIPKNEPYPISATPAMGWEFLNWTGDTAGIANINAASTTITTNIDAVISARFIEEGSGTVQLTVTSNGNGMTFPQGTVNINAGEPYVITAMPDSGFSFSNWSGDTAGIADISASTTTITIEDNTAITANFDDGTGGNKIQIRSSDGLFTIDKGECKPFFITLKDPPSNPLVLSVQAGAGSSKLFIGAGSPTQFNINGGNYNHPTAHAVTLCAAPDIVQTVNRDFLVFRSSGTDPLTNLDFTVTGIDPDNPPGTPNFVVTPNPLAVPEGQTSSFSVTLSEDPGDGNFVDWEVARVDGGTNDFDLFLNGQQTGSNGGIFGWDTVWNIPIHANQDSDFDDGSAVFEIRKVGGNIPINSVFLTANEVDNDSEPPPVVSIQLDQSIVVVPEGSSTQLGVRLSGDPEDPVSVTVRRLNGDSDIHVSKTLSFHSENWGSFQYATVSGLEDDSDILDGAANLEIKKVAGSATVIARSVPAREVDNDFQLTMQTQNVGSASGTTTPPAGTARIIANQGFPTTLVTAQPDSESHFLFWLPSSGNLFIADPLSAQTTIQLLQEDPDPSQISLTAVFGEVPLNIDDDIHPFGPWSDYGFDLFCGDGDNPQIDGNHTNPSHTGAEMMRIYSGQEVRDEMDMFLKGRDHVTDFKITRRHITRKNWDHSIFGPAWTHNYHHYFSMGDMGEVLMTTYGRTDQFSSVGSGVWEGINGRLDRFTLLAGNRALLRTFTGVKLSFLTEGSAQTGTLRGILSQIESPNGNRLQFIYETNGEILERRLLKVIDSFGRPIDFVYGQTGNSPYVTAIIDRSDPAEPRSYVYQYNARGQLNSVRSPTVTATNGWNDFPNGKTTKYTYVNAFDERLRNALRTIVFPNQTTGSNAPRLSWTYDQTNPDSNDFYGFVKTHTVGNPQASGLLAAGGTYTYNYVKINGDDGPNDAKIRVIATDRRGTSIIHKFNGRGQMLEEKVVNSGQGKMAGNDFTRQFKYNAEGDMIEAKNPVNIIGEKGMYQESQPNPNLFPRHMHAQERVQLIVADNRGSDQAVRRIENAYEPVFNKIFATIDPRAFDPDSDFTPKQLKTLTIYDYMEDLTGAINHFAPDLGLSPTQLRSFFIEAGVVQALAELGVGQGEVVDLNEDGLTDQRCGNKILIIHPIVALPEQATRVGLPLIQEAQELFQYNEFGQLTHYRDAEENVTLHEYFPAEDPAGTGEILPGVAPNVTGGFLKQTISDALALPGSNSGHPTQPAEQITSYGYSEENGGFFRRNHRGIPTSVTDGRGIESVFMINELDQMVRTKAAQSVSQASEPGLIPYRYVTRVKYDANDNLILSQIQNKDTIDGDNDYIATHYQFDILDQVRIETLDQGAGNHEIQTWTEYDANQNLVKKIRGYQTDEASIESWEYDERNNKVSHTRGLDAPEASTITYEIDDNSNITKTFDAAGGDVSETRYDGYDRPVETIDRVGNRTVNSYDVISNVIKVERFGNSGVNPAGQPGSESRLAITFNHFDERNRAYQTDRSLYKFPGTSSGGLNDGDLFPGDGKVNSLTLFDRLGRAVGRIDADDDTWAMRFDGLSRKVFGIDPLGNETHFTYDANDNLIEMVEVEQSSVDQGTETFITQTTFDSLNRRTSMVEPNGQTTRYNYDSRNNLIRTTDALGNTIDRRFDRINRPIDTRTYLSLSGTGASAAAGDPAIVIGTTYDALHRMATQTDDKQQTTEYIYDDLDRKIRCNYADGTFEEWRYNADSELQRYTNQNGAITVFTHDAAGRKLSLSVDPSAATDTTLGTTQRAWFYDGLNRVVSAIDDNGSPENAVLCEYRYDSLSRIIRERQYIEGLGLIAQVDTSWQGVNRKTAITYPNGERVRRTYDSLDRLFEIRETGTGLISRFEYVGPNRIERVTHGNGTVLDKRNSYDSNRRSVIHRWRQSDSAGANLVVSHNQTYNGIDGNQLGTNRVVSEAREHFGLQDHYTLDSGYRMTEFMRDAPLQNPQAGIASSRVLDGTDKMTEFTDEGQPQNPILGGTGMNQYAAFANQARAYNDNASLTDDNQFQYFYDFQNRLVEIHNQNGETLAKYRYAADHRRVLKTTPATTTRFIYDGWQVLEERNGENLRLRRYVDARHLDEHCQLRLPPQPDLQAPRFAGETLDLGSNDLTISVGQAFAENELQGHWLRLELDEVELYFPIAYQAATVPQPGGQYLLSMELAHTNLFDLLRETYAITHPISGIDVPLRFTIFQSQGQREDFYYHTNPQGMVSGLTDGNQDLVELVSYSWLGQPRFFHGDQTIVDNQNPDFETTLFQGIISGVNLDGDDIVLVILGHEFPLEENILAGTTARMPLDPFRFHTPYIATISGNYSQETTPGVFDHFIRLENGTLFRDLNGSQITVHPHQGNASLIGNPYLFQGRRLDRETGLYYFRRRFYDPLAGEFLTLDPKGYWAHGQGNGYSAFNENPWQHLDPMGLQPQQGPNGNGNEGVQVFAMSRDLDLHYAIGQSHTFFAITFEDPNVYEQMRPSRVPLVDLGNGVMGITVGGHQVAGELRILYNQGADIAAANEAFGNTGGLTVNFFDAFTVSTDFPAFTFSTHSENLGNGQMPGIDIARQILNLSANYIANSIDNPIDYNALPRRIGSSANCNSLFNSMLRVMDLLTVNVNLGRIIGGPLSIQPGGNTHIPQQYWEPPPANPPQP